METFSNGSNDLETGVEYRLWSGFSSFPGLVEKQLQIRGVCMCIFTSLVDDLCWVGCV